MADIKGMTAAEIATALGGKDRTTVLRRARRESWSNWDETTRGGRRKLYAVMALPLDVREAVLAHLARAPRPDLPAPANESAPGARPLPPVAFDPARLCDWQRAVAEARVALLHHLDRLIAAGGTNRGVDAMVAAAAAGGLPPALQALVPVANARSGGGVTGRALSVRTLKRWLALARRAEAAGASRLSALAPRAAATPGVPGWAPAFLAAWRRPSHPSVPEAIAAMTPPPGVARPTEAQARRFLTRLSAVERERGRRGPGALRALRPFVRRSAEGLLPLQVVVCDGHAAKFDWQHPIHGKPFRPELTAVLDVATRKVVGWSADLSESTWAVMAAYAHMARSHGLAAIAYSDNGSGQTGRVVADAVSGLLARLGTTQETGRPGNPQGRGLIERVWEKLWLRPGRLLPSYAGRDMDPEARRRVVKLTGLHLREAATSPLLPTWREGLEWAGRAVEAYNAAPHAALPRIRDPLTGRMRHLSPDEAWRRHVEAGWEPVTLTPAEAEDLFRPHVVRKVRRAEVSLFGQTYFAMELEPHHGDSVQVGFDVHDPSRVWVRTLDGVLIAVAEADGNARPYFDRIRLERAERRLRTLDRRRAEVLGELGQGVLDLDPAPATPAPPARPDPGAAIGPPAKPRGPGQELNLYRWCLDHADGATRHDWDYLRRAYGDTPRFARLVDREAERRGLPTPFPAAADGTVSMEGHG